MSNLSKSQVVFSCLFLFMSIMIGCSEEANEQAQLTDKIYYDGTDNTYDEHGDIIEATVDVSEYDPASGAFGDDYPIEDSYEASYQPEFQVYVHTEVNQLNENTRRENWQHRWARDMPIKYDTFIDIASENDETIKVNNVLINRGHCRAFRYGKYQNPNGYLGFGDMIRFSLQNCQQNQVLEVMIQTNKGDVTYSF